MIFTRRQKRGSKMQSSFKHVKITGISTAIPQKEINIYDEAQYYGNSVKKIDRMRKMVGFYKRRVVEEGTTASDLGICAAKQLIKGMNINSSEIDALVYVVQKPDYEAPATAFYIHHKLGLPETIPAFDINMGCAGFVYGIWTVSQMIESKTCKKILLICADTPTLDVDLADRNVAPIFGDGGSAVLVEYSEDEIYSFYNIETKSSGYYAIIDPAKGHRLNLQIRNKKDFDLILKYKDKKIQTPDGRETTFFHPYLNGIEVFDFTISVVPQNIKKLLDYANLKDTDIEALCLHQANKQIIQAIGNAAGFPEDKVPYHAFENFGNNTMCSIPTTICSALKDKTEQSCVKILGSGFGNGLTCASCILTLDNIYNSGIVNYQLPEKSMSKEEYIEYWIKKIKGE